MQQLPACIKASRIGHHSYGESEYDAMGEQAPVTWTCNCGASLTLERMDYDTEQYVPVSEHMKAHFLATHTTCTAKCYKCGTASVERHGHWCEKCTEEDDSFF